MTNRKPNRLRVGVIGLGTIGSRAAANLRAAGHQVYVWNRTPRSEPNFLGSAAEVTDLCDVLQLFVTDDAALLATVRAVAPALKPRHLVLAHPTVSPAAAREAAAIVEGTGARYLDAPFTGSRAAAGNGQLVYYVSGPEPARRDALPVLEATSKNVVVIGDDVGQATVTKIASNLLTAAIVQSLAEALALARAAGVDPARFSEAMEHNGSRSVTGDLKLPAMIRGDHATPHFALKHMLKDARLALALAADHGLTLPATATVAAQLYGADRRGWGELDFAALARNYDDAPPAPAFRPTVIPETLPTAAPPPAPSPVPPPEPPSPSPAPTLGLPAIPDPAEPPAAPAAEPAIPRGGLPFPPDERPTNAPPGRPAPPAARPDAASFSSSSSAPPPGEARPLPDLAAVLPPGKPAPPTPPAEAGNPEALTVRPANGDDAPARPAGLESPGVRPLPASTPSPPAAREEAPAPESGSQPAEEPGSERPPATRRTLLSWFQRGK